MHGKQFFCRAFSEDDWMKRNKTAPIRLPQKSASYDELADFFDRHDGTELLKQGIMEPNPDRKNLDRMLREYWKRPNTRQLNIRLPAGAKRLIEKLARRNTIQVSTLVRMWVIEGMRREATKS